MSFWQTKTLDELSKDEWESLCDGCALCCMVKLEDEDSGEVHHTAMVCNYLDLDTCRCTDYARRHTNVPDCVVLTPERAKEFTWLPKSCAYRSMAEGRGLPDWHPLLTGDPASVVAAGESIVGRIVPEQHVPLEAYEEFIIRWVN